MLYIRSEFDIFINMSKKVFVRKLKLARVQTVFQKNPYDLNRPVMLVSSPDHKMYSFEIS